MLDDENHDFYRTNITSPKTITIFTMFYNVCCVLHFEFLKSMGLFQIIKFTTDVLNY